MMDHFIENLEQQNPARMGVAERLDEVAAILAAGLKRSRANKSSSLFSGNVDFPLDVSPAKSGVHRRKLRQRSGD